MAPENVSQHIMRNNKTRESAYKSNELTDVSARHQAAPLRFGLMALATLSFPNFSHIQWKRGKNALRLRETSPNERPNVSQYAANA